MGYFRHICFFNVYFCHFNYLTFINEIYMTVC